MAHSLTSFPLSGVIGIVDKSISQLDLAKQYGLTSVEIRADLLRSGSGLSDNDLLSVVSAAKAQNLSCLFTMRHADQGGSFSEPEAVRVALCTQALEAGADIIDLEHGTASASAMLKKSAPMILSYHNFDRMVDTDELKILSAAMEAQAPAAVKIIPTGHSLADAATMLAWVANAGPSIKRIGFSMGSDGATSRILALKLGAPVTYASFGEPVAPGQVDIRLMLERYQCMSMTEHTKIIALVGDQISIDRYHNQHASAEHSVIDQSGADEDKIYIGFSVEQAAAIKQFKQAMNINDITYL